MHVELAVREGEQVGRRLRLEPGQTCLLGRAREATLRIRDEDASRRHALLRLTPRGLEVTDLGSRNGTHLGARKLIPDEPSLAAARDLIAIGRHRIEVTLVGGPASPGPRSSIREEYEQVAELGRGGHGVVFAARHRASGRRVAIKALLPEAAGEATTRRRFLREAAIRLDSPHVVQVHEVRLEGEQVFIVMEYVPGRSLASLLGPGPLPLAQALALGEQVALALAVAHAAEIVHRDVKPANVLVTPAGLAKLADFGLAKPLDAETLTATATGMGSVAYVAPEQIEDAKWVDALADLYSLGATLFHMLAGRPPFLPNDPQVLVSVQEEDPPALRELRPELPPGVVELVHQLLAKDPDERPPDAAGVAQRLRALRGGA